MGMVRHTQAYYMKVIIDYVSLGGCGQAYPGTPKENFKAFLSQKLMGGIKLILGMQLHIY